MIKPETYSIDNVLDYVRACRWIDEKLGNNGIFM